MFLASVTALAFAAIRSVQAAPLPAAAAPWLDSEVNKETQGVVIVVGDISKIIEQDLSNFIAEQSPVEHADNAAQWFVDVYDEYTGKTKDVYVDPAKVKRSPIQHAGNAAQWFVDVYDEATGETKHV